MTDIWVCSTCHSINRQRGSSCYKCGAPQSAAISALADVRTELAMQARAGLRYRSSILRAIVAAVFIFAYAVLGVVVLFESLTVAQYVRDQIPSIMQGELDEAELLRMAAPALVPALLKTICGLGALLFFAAWLSRVIMNVPALGGGTPNTTPTKAFVYPLIPFWNLFKTPPMIQEALYRVDPKAGGFFMILVAWVGLVGSAIVGFIGGWWVNLRIATVATRSRTLGDAIAVVQGAYDMQLLIDIVTILMSSFGAIVLVMIMFRIESRARARDREIRKATRTPRAEPGSVEARPGGVRQEAAAASTAPAGPTVTALVPGPLGFVPAEPTPARPVADAFGPSVPAGPRLHLHAESGTSMIVTLGGVSEPITLHELPAAAAALADADGSAVVTSAAADPDAKSLAGQALDLLSGAGVPTAMAD